MKKLPIALATTLLLSAAEARATPLIDTVTGWDGTQVIFPFGEPNTATYGQTFTVTGPETILNSFTFLINDFDNPDTVEFQGFVYAWDAGTFHPTGPALFSTGPLSTTPDGPDVFEAFTINAGGLSLVAASQYVAFFSASNLFDGSPGTSNWAASQLVNPYAGGQFVFKNNGSVFGDILTTSWDTCNLPGPGTCFVGQTGNMDLAFQAQFTTAPEPGSLVLLGAVLLALGLRNRLSRY